MLGKSKRLAARAHDIRERFQRVSDVSFILRSLAPRQLREAGFVDERFRGIVEELADLRTGNLKLLKTRFPAIEEQLEELERILIVADGNVSAHDFRCLLHPDLVTNAALSRYARLLVEHSDGAPQQLDRIEYFVTRLLTLRESDKELREPVPEERAREILLDLKLRLGRPRTRSAALAYFQDASARLQRIESIEAFFASELYGDLRDFKTSLDPETRLDTEVLYSAVLLNIEIANRLDSLLDEDVVSAEELDDRLDQTSFHVLDLFRPLFDVADPFQERFRRIRREI